MRVCVFYRSNSEQARSVEEFIHEFERLHSKRVEVLNVNTRDGAVMANLYDIFQFPTITVLQDDGQVVQMWSGDRLPLMGDVAAHLSL